MRPGFSAALLSLPLLSAGCGRATAPPVERSADATTDAVLRWLAARRAGRKARPRPFFLWVHYFDPHTPYEPPGKLAERFRSAPYDGEVAFVDRQLGRVLRWLDGAGETPRTLAVALSDHGEALGEHGESTHGLFVYDATLRVPWIMAGPGVAEGRVSGIVARGIDLLPTLLDYAGLPIRPEIEGRSLRPAAEGHAMSDAPAYAESPSGTRAAGRHRPALVSRIRRIAWTSWHASIAGCPSSAPIPRSPSAGSRPCSARSRG